MEIKSISHLLSDVKEKNPLVLHYTNEVTINDCANMTLAIGASPLMSYSYEEVEDIISVCSAVVINIGTMNSSRLELFLQAGKKANELGKPIILDPVGVFASKHRGLFVETLLKSVKFDVIKGNSAEIQFISGLEAQGKGVDASDEVEINHDRIMEVAKALNTTLVMTGKIDTITDGVRMVQIHNGSDKLKSITGTGCMTASLIGGYLGVSNRTFDAACMGILSMSLCGELADEHNPLIGDYKIQLFNKVYSLNEHILCEYGKVVSK